ncbi:MAG: hypothetical protein FJ086_17905 [Deltaproteobacteria bacterium]|nr:hypothetical protein [Deltaproteobacteria bacterium]
MARDVSLRVDVLAAVHLHSTGQLPDRPFAFDGQSSLLLPSLGARVLYGTSLAALGGLRAGVLNFTAMDGLSTNAFEAAAQMGAGYHVEMAPNFRLTPWVAAELGVRTLGNVGSHTYFLLGAGATARADVTPSLSLLLEAAWFPVGYSAGFDAFLGNTGPRLGIGVGFF